jgi:hypothetical protein
VLVVIVTLMAWGAPARAQDSGSAKGSGPGDDTTTEPQADTRGEATADDSEQAGFKAWLRKKINSFTSPTPETKNRFFFFGGVIVAGSGLAAGAGYERHDFLRPNLDLELEAAASVRRYQRYRAAIGRLDARDSTLELDTADSSVPSLFNASAHKSLGTAVYLDTRYRDYPRHSFFGTGLDSHKGDKADYTLRGVSVEGVWQRQLTPQFGLSARGGYLGLDVSAGRDSSLLNLEDRFVAAAIPGAIEPPVFFTFGVGVVHDTRTTPAAPNDGGFIGVSVRRFAAHDAPGLSFTRLTLEGRTYGQPGTSRGVVALRLLASNDFTGTRGSTPFYLQATLGGGETLRGYHSYRFRDQAMVHGTVEYRWRVHRFVEVAPFLDMGTVGPGFADLAWGSLKASPGIGVRIRTNRRAIGRLDWARSPEGQRVVFSTGPAF